MVEIAKDIPGEKISENSIDGQLSALHNGLDGLLTSLQDLRGALSRVLTPNYDTAGEAVLCEVQVEVSPVASSAREAVAKVSSIQGLLLTIHGRLNI